MQRPQRRARAKSMAFRQKFRRTTLPKHAKMPAGAFPQRPAALCVSRCKRRQGPFPRGKTRAKTFGPARARAGSGNAFGPRRPGARPRHIAQKSPAVRLDRRAFHLHLSGAKAACFKPALFCRRPAKGHRRRFALHIRQPAVDVAVLSVVAASPLSVCVVSPGIPVGLGWARYSSSVRPLALIFCACSTPT